MAEKILPLGPFQRFGILGGSFNPVHVGHLSIAQQVLAACKLQRVFLMPAAANPHKLADRGMASAEDRLAMCRLAVQNMHGLAVSDLELRRSGPSYTVDTAQILRKAYGPDAEIRFLIGSDTLLDLPKWKNVQDLLKLADFAVANRREAPLKEQLWERLRAALGADRPEFEKLRRSVVPIEPVDVSATQIRRLLREGERLPGYLRKDVEAYIRRKLLYGAPPQATRGRRIVSR